MADGTEYRGYIIRKHGRRWRVQVRPKPIVRNSVESVRDALDTFLAAREREHTAGHQAAFVSSLGPGHITVGELCDRWYAWKTGPHSDEPIRAATRHDYRYTIDRYITPLIGLRDAASITTNELKKDFFRVCTSRTKARFARTVLRQSFRWGIEEGLVARRDNPVVDILLVRRESYDGRNRKAMNLRAVTDDEISLPEEVQKMLAWALEMRPDRWLRDWWLWLYIDARLGLRPSECTALQTEDFDPRSGVVRIRRAVPDRHDIEDWYL